MAPKSVLAADHGAVPDGVPDAGRERRVPAARLVGLAMAADGALLVSDDTNGMIYRISHEAGEG